MTPIPRQRLHEACPCLKNGFFCDEDRTCECYEGDKDIGAIQCRWPGHVLIDSIPDAPEPLPAEVEKLAAILENAVMGSSGHKAAWEAGARLVLADRKATVEDVVDGCNDYMQDFQKRIAALEEKLRRAESERDSWRASFETSVEALNCKEAVATACRETAEECCKTIRKARWAGTDKTADAHNGTLAAAEMEIRACFGGEGK